MVIEKDEEILISYRGDKNEFLYGSREFRRQKLLRTDGFLCECSECSLEGSQIDDGIGAELRQKTGEI